MLTIGALNLKNWLVMAPMAGITNLPFRLLVKRLGAGLVTTEMISAMGLTRRDRKTFDYLKSHPDERPLSAQIFGSNPAVMSAAAEIAVEAGADMIDINMGCPAKKVTKTGAGGALMRCPEKVKEIVTAVRSASSVPLTVKMRAGWSPKEMVACHIARMAEDCGADAVSVHPRFVSQGFSGQADWEIIGKVKESVKIPVIGSGDVFEPRSALEMRRRTACDGVMVGRAAVGNPWIFEQILELEGGMALREPTPSDRRALIIEHFRLLCDSMGENRAARIMRGLLLRYTKGLPYSTLFRREITRIHDYKTLLSVVGTYFSSAEEMSS
jgi:tRNA-dihydrouridine synthase B